MILKVIGVAALGGVMHDVVGQSINSTGAIMVL